MGQLYKKIALTQGEYAIVDEEDYEKISSFKWHVRKTKHAKYAGHSERAGKTCVSTRMHRVILGLKKGDGLEVDHINRNGLDNRRCNLRICTKQQNQMNSIKKRGNNKYKGVSFFKAQKKYAAIITKNRKKHFLGCYCNKEKAAIAYNEAAIRYFGEYARLNEVQHGKYGLYIF